MRQFLRKEQGELKMAKNNSTIQIFDALDWMARLVTHITNKGEQFGKVNCEAREANLSR
jgi:hypothetical protein